MQNKILQSQLRDLRRSAGFTQSELAKKLRKPQSYVSKFESGERRLDLLELREVVEACDSSLRVFVENFEKKLKE